MKISILALLVLVASGCGGAAGSEPCAPLAPASSGQPATVSSASTGDLCLHLDTRSLSRAHLAVQSASEPGTTSSYSLRLSQRDGTLIQEGWNVTVGGDPASSFQNLEWSPPTGTELDVVLRVVRSSPTPATRVTISLLDPLE